MTAFDAVDGIHHQARRPVWFSRHEMEEVRWCSQPRSVSISLRTFFTPTASMRRGRRSSAASFGVRRLRPSSPSSSRERDPFCRGGEAHMKDRHPLAKWVAEHARARDAFIRGKGDFPWGMNKQDYRKHRILSSVFFAVEKHGVLAGSRGY